MIIKNYVDVANSYDQSLKDARPMAQVEGPGLDSELPFAGALYQANENDKYAYFEPAPTIEGFPAVALDVVEDRYAGRCTVVVGVSDEITFAVPVQLSAANVGKREPCEAAVEVAGMALRTMKQG